jgi:hypothetical protein
VPESEKNEQIIDQSKTTSNDGLISIIYNQKNDSPKYFAISKSKILLFVIGLPTVTLIALVLGAIGLVHTSPFHLIDAYRQNSLARDAVSKTNSLINQIQAIEEENKALTSKLAEAQGSPQIPAADAETATKTSAPPTASQSVTSSSIGLATLSLFRPIQGQKDRTKPSVLNLSGFQVVGNRDTTNLQFNIIPANEQDGKIAGYIIVLMKNELTIQVYPAVAFGTNETQINYSSGEPFSTQRFRPVNANFLKPRKPGNYTFSAFIFAKNGDLLHYQSVILPVKF